MAMRQRSSKSKTWMEDYKQLIIDMKTELEKLTSENESLKNFAHQHKIKQEQSQTMIGQLQKQLKSIQQQNEIREEQILSQTEKMKRQIRQQKSVLDQIINQNKELKIKISTFVSSNNQLSSQLTATTLQLNKKNTIVAELEANLSQIKKKVSQQQLQSETKFNHLQEINDFVKQIFERIEKDYSSFLKNQQNCVTQSPPVRKSMNKKKIEQSTFCKSNYKVTPFKVTNKQEQTENMSDHLRNIKREIVQQYHKIQHITESVLHKKVDRTLTVIENILSQMSEKVEDSESEITV